MDQLMDEEDLDMVQTVLTKLYDEDDVVLHSGDYRALEGSDDDDEPDDAEAV